MRRGGLGESASDDEARHHQQGRYVDAAGVGGRWSFLSGEVCSGVAAAGGDRLAREGGADRAEVSRGRSTGGDRCRRREGPNVEWAEDLVLLVPVAMIAAIPCTRAHRGGRR